MLCMGCIENKQKTDIEDPNAITPVSEEDIAFIDSFARELDEAEKMASTINKMKVMDYYSQPNPNGYIFPEEVFYMNESERTKVEFTESIINFNRTPIHFVGLNKIEEFGDVKYGRSHLNSIVFAAFTPMYGAEDEQLNCIIFSRNILLNHCFNDEHEERLKNTLQIIDTWGQFRYSIIQANVPMNFSDTNRTFAIDNVEDMNVIMNMGWKQDDLEQYFNFLDTSGFNSSEELLTFSRQFTTAEKCIDNNTSDSRQKKINEAREYVIDNFPQYSDNGIEKSDLCSYFDLCDKKQ